MTTANESILCVDLDGSLVATDLMAESILLLLKKNPLYLIMLPVWLLRGRAYLKHEIARRVKFNAANLPYHTGVLSWLREEHRRGRRIILATAGDGVLASCVADHLGLFAAVHASDGRTNLKGPAKLAFLADRYGSRGFAYVGNSLADLSIWRRADSAIIVGGSDVLAAQVAASTPVVRRFDSVSNHSTRALLQAMRPHQWVKNLLLFVPLVTAHQLANMTALGAAVRAFAAMCLASAAIYIVNDLLDLESDRAHVTKRLRAFASGQSPIWSGMLLAPALVVAALVIASGLPREFMSWLAVYILATTAYSLRLKHIAIIDVLMLAMLYTVRLIAGAAAIEVPVSAWLLAFSLFFFLSLALLKRFSEIDAGVREGDGPVSIRGYLPVDRDAVGQFGAVSGYLSILVMALYTNSREVVALYSDPVWLWGFCPLLLYWISSIWLSAYRGDMHEDPIMFAVRQVSSYIVVAGLGAFMYLAI